ncbi:MAG: hypothetical protein K8W52_04395 [Deltaproteobacteria bacterium]|nr:hypothetical protein [Deltaproteobacteria bacterium]
MVGTTTALAQPASPAAPAMLTPPAMPDGGAMPADQDKQPKQPKAGDFDAGGQVRFPSGPDEMGQFATYNWIAADLKARYYLLPTVTVDALAPLAVHKPSMLMNGTDPRLMGGVNLHLEARLPKLPRMPGLKYDTELGLALSLAYMREGALLLSDKDYPLFVGSFHPGVVGGLITKIKLSTLVDFSLTPSFAYQRGSVESLTAIQVPTSLDVRLGSVVQVSADAGVFTGDDISLRGKNGGRVALGGSLTIKIGPIVTHAGAGFASLLTGGIYPTVRDSLYVDLNVKYAK